jgi:hypothetical protein
MTSARRALLTVLILASACTRSATPTEPPAPTTARAAAPEPPPLPSWNDGAAKKSITDFVERVTKRGA